MQLSKVESNVYSSEEDSIMNSWSIKCRPAHAQISNCGAKTRVLPLTTRIEGALIVTRLRTGVVRSLFLAAALLAQGAAFAQTYPDKPIRIVVPYPPSGVNDIVARALAVRVTESIGQPVLVENRPGASGKVGTEYVARAAADGYTVLVGGTGTHSINPALNPKLSYDPVRDFAPITLLSTYSMVLVVNPSLPVATVSELIAWAKARPGVLTVASAGAGGAQHLAWEMFRLATGLEGVHVPYKGSVPALNDVVGGQVQAMIDLLASAVPMVRAGKLRALAVTSSSRVASLPDVPTFAEAGVPNYVVVNWNGLFAPAGTPRPAIERLNAEFVRALNIPEVRRLLVTRNADPGGGTPEEFGTWVRDQLQRWTKVIREAGISPTS